MCSARLVASEHNMVTETAQTNNMIQASTSEALRSRKTTVVCFVGGGTVVATVIGIVAVDRFVKSSAEESVAQAGPKVIRSGSILSHASTAGGVPTSEFTEHPTAFDTNLPTNGPGVGPSKLLSARSLLVANAPSNAPNTTNFPTTSPTTSPIPTDESSQGLFRIRMHWQPGYMWQKLPDEGWFCLACARCDLNNLFGGLKGCDIEKHCEENMHLALTSCEPSKLGPAKLAEIATFKFLFDEVEDGLDGDQIQVHGTNVCIQQVLPGGTGSIELRQCDSSLKAQRFGGAKPVGKAMELLPVSGNSAKCLTNQ
jgi:hypothetical protein